MSVHRLLVTSTDPVRMGIWAKTGTRANWIEGRENRHGTETWIVTVFDEDFEDFMTVARDAEATVEEVQGAGDTETYLPLTGTPGTGWGMH